jgi:hypothetical protein
MTKTKIEEMEALRRQSEARNRDLLNYINDGTSLTHAAKNEVKVGQVRRMNNMARVAAENMVAVNVAARERQDAMNSLVHEQNQKLASEISARNAERERMEREIQRVCDTSEELKDLERKLNIAYVNKERAAQHQESLLLKHLEAARESAIDDQMEYERQLFLKKEMDKEDVRRVGMMEQKTVLQKQILDRQVLAVEAREEAERDKEMVAAIVDRINEQDRLEIEEKNAKKEETRALVKYFQQEREKKKAAIIREQEEQEAEIKAYVRASAKKRARRRERLPRKAICGRSGLESRGYSELQSPQLTNSSFLLVASLAGTTTSSPTASRRRSRRRRPRRPRRRGGGRRSCCRRRARTRARRSSTRSGTCSGRRSSRPRGSRTTRSASSSGRRTRRS